jgi:hypothetical protein
VAVFSKASPSELTIRESSGRLEIYSPMPWGRRVFIGVIGLFPLLAPWELLVQPRWSSYLNVPFLFAAVVSAGAVAVTLFFLLAAFAGLQSRLIFDALSSTFTYAARAPLVPSISRTYPLSAVKAVELRTHVWSEGPDSYSLTILTSDGNEHESSSSSSREEIESCRLRATAFFETAKVTRPPETGPG